MPQERGKQRGRRGSGGLALEAANAKVLRRHFHALLVSLCDPETLGSSGAVIRLICNAGLAAAVNLQRSAAGLTRIGLVRSAEMASDWLVQLPPGRSPAFTGVPGDLLRAIVANEMAREEVLGLLRANRVLGPEMQRMLCDSPTELGRTLAGRVREIETRARERLPGLMQDVKDLARELSDEGTHLLDDVPDSSQT